MNSTKNEINSAITAHGSWKQKLREAIATGQSESTPDRVCKDNNCSFGKWLHERIDPAAKSSPHYTTARKLHADFHIEAAKILKLALEGKKEEATQGISLSSPFMKISGELTRKMKAWEESLT